MFDGKIVNQIVAVNNKGFIGKDGHLMWHNKEDLKHFKDITMWNALVVGRKTLDTLPSAVNKGRVLIPVSRSGNSVEEALQKASDIANKNTIFVIGGAEIYKETEKYTDFILLSRIDDDQEGDSSFQVSEDFELKETIQYETFTLEIHQRKVINPLELFFAANSAQENEKVSKAFDYILDVDVTFDERGGNKDDK